MEKEKIKRGDTVRLKSGGPIMTVGSEETSRFQCDWFDGSDLKRGSFYPEQLDLVDMEEQGPVSV